MTSYLAFATKTFVILKNGIEETITIEDGEEYNESFFGDYSSQVIDALKQQQAIATSNKPVSIPNQVASKQQEALATPSNPNLLVVHPRLEVIGLQKGLFGNDIPITQFKNLQQKQETKAKVLAKFKGEIFRSIISPKEIDGNKRLDKLERQHQNGNRSSDLNTMERADQFGAKSILTISTFPSVLTFAYINLLCPEGGKYLDLFAGHNSRCGDVLAMGRHYTGFDVHTFPIDKCLEAASNYPKEMYNLHLQSSESLPYPDNAFDFALTSPPYWACEDYQDIYQEKSEGDLSGKGYEEFLRLYEKCYAEAFRTLKPGAFNVVVIGDVHKGGKFYTLGLDTINICKKVGFTFWDWNLYDRKSNIGGDLNPVMFLETCKRFPTIHEHILIFKKEIK